MSVNPKCIQRGQKICPPYGNVDRQVCHCCPENIARLCNALFTGAVPENACADSETTFRECRKL